MENPHKLVNELSPIKWLWKTSKWDLIIVSVLTKLILITLMAISIKDTWYATGIIIPVWYGLHILRWWYKWKTNKKAYQEWEKNFGGK